MTLGEKILNMRKARGWSQEELAERIGVTRQAVSRWESNSAKPDADKIVAVCDLFGVSADYLLRDDYAGEKNAALPEAQSAASGTKAGKIGLWASAGAAVIGLVLITAIKFLFTALDGTTYTLFTTDRIYHGFEAFLRRGELLGLWYLGIGLVTTGVVVGLFCLFRKKMTDRKNEFD